MIYFIYIFDFMFTFIDFFCFVFECLFWSSIRLFTFRSFDFQPVYLIWLKVWFPAEGGLFKSYETNNIWSATNLLWTESGTIRGHECVLWM